MMAKNMIIELKNIEESLQFNIWNFILVRMDMDVNEHGRLYPTLHLDTNICISLSNKVMFYDNLCYFGDW
jgi:hypothetical protein